MKPFAIVKPQKQLYHYIDLKYRQKIPTLNVQSIKQPSSAPKSQPHVVTKQPQRWSNVHVVERTMGKIGDMTSLARSSYKSQQFTNPVARKLDFSNYQSHRKPIFGHKRTLSVNKQLRNTHEAEINNVNDKKQEHLPQSNPILQNSQVKHIQNSIKNKQQDIKLVESHLVPPTQDRVIQNESQKSQNKSLVQSLDKEKVQYKHVPIFNHQGNTINRFTKQTADNYNQDQSLLLKQSKNSNKLIPVQNGKEVQVVKYNQNQSHHKDVENTQHMLHQQQVQQDKTKISNIINTVPQNMQYVRDSKKNKPPIFSKQNKIYHESLEKATSPRNLTSPIDNNNRMRIYSHLNEVKIQNELQRTQPRRRTSGSVNQDNIKKQQLQKLMNSKKQQIATARKQSFYGDKIKNKSNENEHQIQKSSQRQNQIHRFNTSQMSEIDKSSIYELLSSGSSIVIKSSPPYQLNNSLFQSVQLPNKSVNGEATPPRQSQFHPQHIDDDEPEFKKIIGIGKYKNKNKHNIITPIKKKNSQINQKQSQKSLRSPAQITVPKVLSLRPKGLKKSGQEDQVRNSQSSSISIQVIQIEQMHPFRI